MSEYHTKFHGIDYIPAKPRNTAHLGKNPSRATGASKGDRCQTDSTKKFWLSKDNKAHKLKGYDKWHEKAKRYRDKKA